MRDKENVNYQNLSHHWDSLKYVGHLQNKNQDKYQLYKSSQSSKEEIVQDFELLELDSIEEKFSADLSSEDLQFTSESLDREKCENFAEEVTDILIIQSMIKGGTRQDAQQNPSSTNAGHNKKDVHNKELGVTQSKIENSLEQDKSSSYSHSVQQYTGAAPEKREITSNIHDVLFLEGEKFFKKLSVQYGSVVMPAELLIKPAMCTLAWMQKNLYQLREISNTIHKKDTSDKVTKGYKALTSIKDSLADELYGTLEALRSEQSGISKNKQVDIFYSFLKAISKGVADDDYKVLQNYADNLLSSLNFTEERFNNERLDRDVSSLRDYTVKIEKISDPAALKKSIVNVIKDTNIITADIDIRIKEKWMLVNIISLINQFVYGVNSSNTVVKRLFAHKLSSDKESKISFPIYTGRDLSSFELASDYARQNIVDTFERCKSAIQQTLDKVSIGKISQDKLNSVVEEKNQVYRSVLGSPHSEMSFIANLISDLERGRDSYFLKNFLKNRSGHAVHNTLSIQSICINMYSTRALCEVCTDFLGHIDSKTIFDLIKNGLRAKGIIVDIDTLGIDVQVVFSQLYNQQALEGSVFSSTKMDFENPRVWYSPKFLKNRYNEKSKQFYISDKRTFFINSKCDIQKEIRNENALIEQDKKTQLSLYNILLKDISCSDINISINLIKFAEVLKEFKNQVEGNDGEGEEEIEIPILLFNTVGNSFLSFDANQPSAALIIKLVRDNKIIAYYIDPKGGNLRDEVEKILEENQIGIKALLEKPWDEPNANISVQKYKITNNEEILHNHAFLAYLILKSLSGLSEIKEEEDFDKVQEEWQALLASLDESKSRKIGEYLSQTITKNDLGSLIKRPFEEIQQESENFIVKENNQSNPEGEYTKLFRIQEESAKQINRENSSKRVAAANVIFSHYKYKKGKSIDNKLTYESKEIDKESFLLTKREFAAFHFRRLVNPHFKVAKLPVDPNPYNQGSNKPNPDYQYSADIAMPDEYNENTILTGKLIDAMKKAEYEDGNPLFEGFDIVLVREEQEFDESIANRIGVSIFNKKIKIYDSAVTKKMAKKFDSAIVKFFPNVDTDEDQLLIELNQENVNKDFFDLDAQTAKAIQEIFDAEYAQQLAQEEYQLDFDYLNKFKVDFDIQSIGFLLSKYFGGFVGRYEVKKEYTYNKNTIPSEDIVFNPAGDGNCFYSSFLGNQEQASPYNINTIRNRVADYIQNHQQDYFERIMLEAVSYYHQYGRLPVFFNMGATSDERDTFLAQVMTYEESGTLGHIDNTARDGIITQYTNNVRRDGVWAGNIEIGVVVELENVAISVHRSSGEITEITPLNPNNNTGNINLYYTGAHYMRVSDNPRSVFEENKRDIVLKQVIEDMILQLEAQEKQKDSGSSAEEEVIDTPTKEDAQLKRKGKLGDRQAAQEEKQYEECKGASNLPSQEEIQMNFALDQSRHNHSDQRQEANDEIEKDSDWSEDEGLDDMEGATRTDQGMSCEAANMNLVEMCKANSNKELEISSKVINSDEVARSIKSWLDGGVSTEFTAVVKVKNYKNCFHAINIHAKRDDNNVKVEITDSLPKEEFSFKEVLEELKAVVQSGLAEDAQVTITRTGEQTEEDGTCVDLSLIRISDAAQDKATTVVNATVIADSSLGLPSNKKHFDKKLELSCDAKHLIEEIKKDTFDKKFEEAKKKILETLKAEDKDAIDEVLAGYDAVHHNALLSINYGGNGFVAGRIVRLENGQYRSESYVTDLDDIVDTNIAAAEGAEEEERDELAPWEIDFDILNPVLHAQVQHRDETGIAFQSLQRSENNGRIVESVDEQIRTSHNNYMHTMQLALHQHLAVIIKPSLILSENNLFNANDHNLDASIMSSVLTDPSLLGGFFSFFE